MNGLNRVYLSGDIWSEPKVKNEDNADGFVFTFRMHTVIEVEEKMWNEWHNVIIKGQNAANAQKILKKGDTLYLEGRINTRKYDFKEGVQYMKYILVINWQKIYEAI